MNKKLQQNELKNIVNSEVDTPDGKATLKEIYVTELGYIMAKIFYPKKGVFVNHQIAVITDLLGSKNINLLTAITERVTLEEKLVD